MEENMDGQSLQGKFALCFANTIENNFPVALLILLWQEKNPGLLKEKMNVVGRKTDTFNSSELLT